MPVLRHAPL